MEAWKKRNRPSGRQPPPHREKLLSPRPGGERLREDPRRRSVSRGTGLGGGWQDAARPHGLLRINPGVRTECWWQLSSSSVGPVSPTPTSPPSAPPPFPFSRLLLLSFPLSPPPARLPLPLRLSALGLSCHRRVVLPRFPFPTQPALRPSLARHSAPLSRARCIIYLLVFNFLPGGFLPPTRARSGAGAPRGGPGREEVGCCVPVRARFRGSSET